MADIYRLHGSSHDEVQAILPWYVNGTLSPEEIARVEAHLAECEECCAELESERALAKGIASLPLSLEGSWWAMRERMAAEAGAEADRKVAFLRRKVPMGWAIGGPLAAAAAVALMVTLIPPGTPVEQTYHALGSPSAQNGGNLVVLFKPDTTEQQMRVILSANDARVVDGPTAAGAYVLRIDDARQDHVLGRLRQSSQIVLAEPISPTVR